MDFWEKIKLCLMARSIKKHGILVPIILASNGTVLDGRTRIHIARKLGEIDVPCAVIPNVRIVSIPSDFFEWEEHNYRVELHD